ncbi:MAG TPA: Holliday junction branch migration protein RuvA [Ignavibacteria bacterium]|nr:Holliday junction branch migration protein RuvA [Ignavibacteria bacterium]
MIAYLKGKILVKKFGELVLDVNGVGYQIFVTKKISQREINIGDEIAVITYLDVKENALNLYGFDDEKEREMFKLLISVNGIGTKMAHNILSNVFFEELIGLITGANFNFKIPGIGTKKLELISMSLKDKVFKLNISEGTLSSENKLSGSEQIRNEALTALLNLGYQRSEAEKSIREVLKLKEGTNLNTEELIKKALSL